MFPEGMVYSGRRWIMKEALGGVRADAAMMRSPSFSREGLSRTIMKSPARKAVIADSMVSNLGEDILA